MTTLGVMPVSRRHFAISVCCAAIAGAAAMGAPMGVPAVAPVRGPTTLSAEFAQTVAPSVDWQLVGAAPVSTGLPGRFDHFETPLGVFDHSVGNPDFRAAGTRNALGIRGYGRKGARVYDFGWVVTTKGWGDRKPIAMRLQMHATDPDRLEPRLGTEQSKGCIRIPASLNAFLDHFAILDEDYEEKMTEGRRLWVLRADRAPTPWAGRYLVVVDSRQRGPADPVELEEP